ncbi:MAG: GNAT family N-acetyltransferase [Actinobacteria bacterium]|nr:GNAT family N-acetyltransferase [Actinomycetota bacterium]
MTSTDQHPQITTEVEDALLDTLVWHALTTTHQHLSVGDDRARRYLTDVAGFVALADDSDASWASLERIVEPGDTVLLSGGAPPALPDRWTPIGQGLGYQMVLETLSESPPIDATIRPLTADDVPQMLALVELTQPGPFRPRTIELGDYYGIVADGALVAMAGERLQVPTHTEVSAVCTHPAFRGRGYAAALTHRVASGILDRGQRPILHLAQTNVGALRVYERLGFAVRRQLPFIAAQAPGGDR